jgi:hypothetical protein
MHNNFYNHDEHFQEKKSISYEKMDILVEFNNITKHIQHDKDPELHLHIFEKNRMEIKKHLLIKFIIITDFISRMIQRSHSQQCCYHRANAKRIGSTAVMFGVAET